MRIVSPGPGNTLRDEYGNCIPPPEGWVFLPSGDAGITRKVTACGEYWKVQFKKGRYTVSKGVWAPADIVARAKNLVIEVRSTEEYAVRLERARTVRQEKECAYKSVFLTEVRCFLNFNIRYQSIEVAMAKLITDHATPVGSGTVARTTMIPIEQRAEHAVIAWMRHKTTAYETMKIPRIKGARREVRHLLAQQSRTLLHAYRTGGEIGDHCPLRAALDNSTSL
jgi:hypothetical protein